MSAQQTSLKQSNASDAEIQRYQAEEKRLLKELEMRAKELANEVIDTIYLGGGTPSVLTFNQIERLIDRSYKLYKIDAD